MDIVELLRLGTKIFAVLSGVSWVSLLFLYFSRGSAQLSPLRRPHPSMIFGVGFGAMSQLCATILNLVRKMPSPPTGDILFSIFTTCFLIFVICVLYYALWEPRGPA